MPVNIVINGVLGRMGREIVRAALDDSDVRISGCLETDNHPSLGRKLCTEVGAAGLDVTIESSIGAVPLSESVCIDFTTPSATCRILESAADRNLRLVIGTTGFSHLQQELVNDSARTMSILMSPNMSLGVNLLFYLTQVAAQRLRDGFDIEIIEAHHRMKKDAPSGTARRLGEIAAQARGLSYEQAVRNGREGMAGERPCNEIGMHAVRGGDIVGDHTVLFAGFGERIELRHAAQSRQTFARGAVAAAKWLADKPAGLYSMRDVLGF